MGWFSKEKKGALQTGYDRMGFTLSDDLRKLRAE